MRTMVFIILLFNGTLELREYNYKIKDYDGDNIISNEEIVISCGDFAEAKQSEISAHSWTDPRGNAWYLFDGTGTVQGHIC
jgi:phage major head subunit gpT-like protein|tara:strand:- start:33 stop:275 length:243 start_codon:yes stop_codon:yes gene_type:complete